ncbi:MAG TPA: hypothetical protein VMF14_23250 [Solirubrobacteraceae bacterium]|nr:hypothetical protein [Solirubrobacteraceae bacterium]
MPQRGPRVSPVEAVLLAGLAAWALFPLVLLLVHAGQLHARFTGADGLIGADGVLGADQLQYLAWIRDASAHGGLTSDLFSFSQGGHVYLQPMFAISGVLYRLGVSLVSSYMVWKLVGIVALGLATIAWARRFFGEELLSRAAAVTISLFLCTPLAALFSWTQWGSGSFGFSLYLLGDELLAADKLWGYTASAIGLALVPVSLLAIERALEPSGGGASTLRSRRGPIVAGRAMRPSRPARRRSVAMAPLAVAGLSALIASWLHPWQGITLGIIFVGLALLRRLRGWVVLAVPAVGAGLPLLYYDLLSHHDVAWKLASHHEVIARLPAIALLAGLGPLALIAALGVRRPDGEVAEQALLLWLGACFVTYFANNAFAPHALQGLSLPLAVLAVRGWQRLRLPALAGVAALVLITIPGLAFNARKFVRTANSDKLVQYYLPQSDAQALDWVTAHGPPGGILAPTPFAAVVPSQTGRAVWVGHGYWSQDYPVQAHQVDRLFSGHLSATASRSFVASTGAAMLVADCHHPADLTRKLGPAVSAVHQFGCARVYVLARAQPVRSASR